MEETYTSCAWTLFSKKDLLLISSNRKDIEIAYGQSLYDYIHPDEVLLAKRDLDKFFNNSLLGGSVTRCRVRDIDSPNEIRYVIVDMIMYVASEDLVLAIFHRLNQRRQGCCGEDTRSIKNIQLLFHQLRSTSFASSAEGAAADKERTASPNQIFHVLDNNSTNKSVLLSWPPPSSDHHYYSNNVQEQQIMASLLSETRQQLQQHSKVIANRVSSCFDCLQKSTRFTSSGDKIHSFVIEYGTITFVLFQIERSNEKQQLRLVQSSQSDYRSSSTTWYNANSNKPIRRTSAPSSPIRKPVHRANPSHSATTMGAKHSSIKLESLLLPIPAPSPPPQPPKRNQCQSCGTESSPEWRRGPTGHKTLCNACGLRYSRSVARQGKMAAKQQQQQQQQHHTMFQSQNMMMSAPQSPTFSNGPSSGSSSPSFSTDYYSNNHNHNKPSPYHYHQSEDSRNMSLQSKKAFYSNNYHNSNTTIMKNANDTTRASYYSASSSNNNNGSSRHHKHSITFAVL